MLSDECRMKEFFHFYWLKKAERSLRLVGVVAPTPRRATSTIRQSSIIIRHSMKFHISNALRAPKRKTLAGRIYQGNLIIQGPKIVNNPDPEQPAGKQIQNAADPFAHVHAMNSEEA